MEDVEILELFSRYGIDAALMAAVAAAITIALNRFVFSKLDLSDRAERVIKLLPYALGILFYSIYSLACNSGINCFFENLADIAQQGIAVGTLSFVLCLLFNKITSKSKDDTCGVDAVAALIDGYICPDYADTAASLLCEAMESGNTESVDGILKQYAADGVTEAELEVVKTLILNLYGVS
ncbi:MAG: hypothetical protein LUF82_00920 [Clostridia bacterium]|nr:hypothetical protein [Clostridia bacterium]